MKKILDDLYYGRISPWERRPTKSPRRKEVNQKISSEKRYFIEKMSVDDCQRFDKLEKLFVDEKNFCEMDAFSYGLKLGIMLMCAVFEDDTNTEE